MLAHQGGWDETLLVVGPMFVVVMLLRLAKRRVAQQAPIYEPPPGQLMPDRPDAPPDDRDDGLTP
ncbi:MAG: hypothetical protein JWN99_454 [Ilumatobacteraceae bacterium]|nr:hypothetical protein [Ilumatobacteraceae bacterium]